ncbi:cold-shock protein [Rubrivirga sp.]|uniref:cold-shock protein n=1 Tax=Rubrivirga sp. TaxID=1885344 RepID=UPI003B51D467
MTKGTITHFNARRGTGFVRHHQTDAGIPFSVRNAQDREFAHGDTVEFAVRGGMAGIAAHNVRRVRATT